MNDAYNWYERLIKPSWAPPSWVFGPIWTFLYGIIAITFGTVFYKVLTKQWPAVVALPFALNLFFNLIFSPIQFGLQNNYLASIDILLVLGTLVWSLIIVYKYAPWITWANQPYLLWVIIATTLQLTVTFLNH